MWRYLGLNPFEARLALRSDAEVLSKPHKIVSLCLRLKHNSSVWMGLLKQHRWYFFICISLSPRTFAVWLFKATDGVNQGSLLDILNGWQFYLKKDFPHTIYECMVQLCKYSRCLQYDYILYLLLSRYWAWEVCWHCIIQTFIVMMDFLAVVKGSKWCRWWCAFGPWAHSRIATL